MLYTLIPQWECLFQTHLPITLSTGAVFIFQTAGFCPIVEELDLDLDYLREKKVAETEIFEYAQFRHLCRGQVEHTQIS